MTAIEAHYRSGRHLKASLESRATAMTPTAKIFNTRKRPMNPKTAWWLGTVMVGIGFGLVAVLAHLTGTDGVPDKDAGAPYERAIVIREYTWDEEPSDLASPASIQATLYMGQGRYFEAAALYRRALVTYEKAQDSKKAPCCIKPSNCCLSRGVNAGVTCQRCLAMYRKAAGTDSVGFVKTLEEYAALLRKMGEAAEAEKLEFRAKAIREQQGRVAASKPWHAQARRRPFVFP